MDMEFDIKRDISTADRLWSKLGDIPINDNEDIEEKFLFFPKGTDRYTIFYWFEEYFNISIGKRYF